MSILTDICENEKFSPETKIPAAGCVMSGGKSRRMGRDKALLELHGKKLIEIAIACFQTFNEVLISAADRDSYDFTGLRVIADKQSDIGPIGGFISVLEDAASDLVCFRPVDAPLVPAQFHILLVQRALAHSADAVIPYYHGHPEPLIACYAKSALPILKEQAAKGRYKVTDSFPLMKIERLELDSPECAESLGDPALWLINANDPDTFSELESRPI